MVALTKDTRINDGLISDQLVGQKNASRLASMTTFLAEKYFVPTRHVIF
jgi:hypothetical protein